MGCLYLFPVNLDFGGTLKTFKLLDQNIGQNISPKYWAKLKKMDKIVSTQWEIIKDHMEI